MAKKLINVDIICPLYNAESYIENLHASFLKQKGVNLNKIYYILTEGKDNTEKFLLDNDFYYEKIKPSEFSHSLVRENAALRSKADVVVFVTQDVVIESEDWLFNLVKDIDHKDIFACFSRQITKYNNLEKYTREFNYPAESRIVSKDDLNKLGLKTFFFSDASSAISTKVFKKLNGYDSKNLPINEDMYIAYKIIMNGYKIKYCADSVVYHSHNFTLREIYDRYNLTGKFFKQNANLDEYGTNGSGAALAKYVLKRIIKDFRIDLLIRFPFDMGARFLGMKAGKG
jgi:rhamnosyltransferase